MKETGNAMIEEAIFILKSGGCTGKALSEADVIRHANSILDKGCRADEFSRVSSYKSPDGRKIRVATCFFAGAVTGALAVLGILFFV